jgi:hypothetical protein
LPLLFTIVPTADQRLHSFASSEGNIMRRIPDSNDHPHQIARAAEALELARRMKPGPERNAALKEAGRLQAAASMSTNFDSRTSKPPK